MKSSKYLILFVIAVMFHVVQAQVFTSDGIEIKETTKDFKRMKIVTDTVRLDSGYGKLDLRDKFRNLKHDVSGTSNFTLQVFVTPLLPDTSTVLYYYGAVPDSSGSFVWIKSSNTADNGKVCVLLYVR